MWFIHTCFPTLFPILFINCMCVLQIWLVHWIVCIIFDWLSVITLVLVSQHEQKLLEHCKKTIGKCFHYVEEVITYTKWSKFEPNSLRNIPFWYSVQHKPIVLKWGMFSTPQSINEVIKREFPEVWIKMESAEFSNLQGKRKLVRKIG